MKKESMKKAVKKPLLVTTEHRGVFFGYGEQTDGNVVTLTDAQMCVYWPASVKGVLGLASVGPLPGSRVTPAVPSITLQKVTAIVDCSEEAEKVWKKQPWN